MLVTVKANQFFYFLKKKKISFFINNISEKEVFPQLFSLSCGFNEPLVDSKVLSLKGERHILLLIILLSQEVSTSYFEN